MGPRVFLPPGRKAGLNIQPKASNSQSMIQWSDWSAVERTPGKVSGTWLFKATRVPVRALFENLEGGATIQEFLGWFPGVTREQVEAVLDTAQRSLEVAS